MLHVDVGEDATLRVRWNDANGDPIDPTVAIVVTAPDGSTSSPAITNDTSAVGLFTAPLDDPVAGVYRVVWSASGTLDAEVTDLVVVGPQLSHGPCEPWAPAEDIFNCAPCSSVAADAIDWSKAEDVAWQASEYLHLVSGRQFAGLCRLTVRPCRQSRMWTAPEWWRTTYDQSWGYCTCGSEGPNSCSCSSLYQISLGRRPVVGIEQVKIDGAVLDPSAYRLDENRVLVRVDGEPWPCCQDLTLADTEDGTFSVSFVHGVEPPNLGIAAARDLACQLYQACTGGECQLPPETTQVTRQGVSLTIQKAGDLKTNPSLGLRSIALFLNAVNPQDLRRGGHIASPSTPAIRRAG